VHEAIAGVGLKLLQALAEKNGVKLSVGDIEAQDLIPVMGDNEGPQPKDAAARLVAHIGHRIPGAKKLEKRLEGKELKAGVLSDLASLGAQLYARNKSSIDDLAETVLSEQVGKLTNKLSQSPVGGDGVVLDFGEVSPETNNNNGGNHDA
jgi:hypothetical protein